MPNAERPQGACPNEFYDIAIKLDKHKSPTQRDFMLHCVNNKLMHIGITSECTILKKGKENVPQKWHHSKRRKRAIDSDYVANKVFKKLDYNESMTTPDKEINALLDEEENNLSRRTKSRHNKEIKIRAFLLNTYSIQNVAREKTMTRYTSENSFRSAFSFAVTLMSTNFI